MPGDVATDALDAVTVSPVHRYSLAGTLTDDLGGPPLVSNGGTFVPGNPLGYAFGANQGLVVTGAVPSVYTIDLVFELADMTSYRKLIDFKERGSDAGLYVHDSQLEFVVIPITGCPGNSCYTSPVVFTANTPVQVTLTRDATGMVVGFVNRIMQISFADTDRTVPPARVTMTWPESFAARYSIPVPMIGDSGRMTGTA